MQMKMPKKKGFAGGFNTKQAQKTLEDETEFIATLFDSFEVPDVVEDENLEEIFLLKSKQSKTRNELPVKKQNNVACSDPSEDMQQRLEIIKNKMKSKKSKPSAKAIKKKKEKLLKKDLKKKLISTAKAMKNEQIKEAKNAAKAVKSENGNKNDDDVKPDVKPDIKSEKVFNEEGKIVFSKIGFAAEPSRAKKSKKEKTIKNPKLILHKLKEKDSQISSLIASGEVEKAEKIKKEFAWQKAMDKIEGKKVKDNTTKLKKTMHKKKIQKKKTKEEWKKREEKVEKGKEAKQKKREENLQKKKDQKKSHKIKQAGKRGRIVLK